MSFRFQGIIATLLQLPMGAIAFVMVPLCGFAATYFGNFRCLTVMLISLPPLGALIGIRLTSLDHRWALLGCSWLQLLVLALIVLSWTILTANVGGHTKRSVANGMWFLFFGAGNIGGANVSASSPLSPMIKYHYHPKQCANDTFPLGSCSLLEKLHDISLRLQRLLYATA